jgi:hypothetical protein
MSSLSWNLHPLCRFYFWKQPRVIQIQIRGTWWEFHFVNRFLGQKLTESTLWVGALSWWRIQSLGQSSGSSTYSFM